MPAAPLCCSPAADCASAPGGWLAKISTRVLPAASSCSKRAVGKLPGNTPQPILRLLFPGKESMSDDGSELVDNNVYAPTQVALTSAAETQPLPPFYVVSTTKLVLLSLATLGMYSLYWFWRHWKRYGIDSGRRLYPVWRSLFAIFFAHSLNRAIDQRLQDQHSRHRWSPGAWATLYVVTVILMHVVSRLPEPLLSAQLAFALTLLPWAAQIVAMVQAQRAANIACGDPSARQNRRLSLANGCWLLVGGLLWLLIVFDAIYVYRASTETMMLTVAF